MSGTDTHAIGVIGRDPEVRALTERIDAASGPGGGALLVRGHAGIGKSTLLDVARAHAVAKGLVILSTTGIQSESRLPFAGLHQLLRPVLHEVDRLPDSYGNAIRAAFGLGDQTTPSPHLIALSTLHLLGECAESARVLLLVDDAQWLDLPTAEVLAFVARRLESDPIVLIATIRDGFESPILGARIQELRVQGLPDADAASLLEMHAPTLTPALRQRILTEAMGNPLALIELSVALSAMPGVDASPSTARPPLTDRLARAFAGRVSSLTSEARSVLHVAAADEHGALALILRAASELEGHNVSLDAAAEAGAAGVAEVDGHHLRFRHPLMRSAIYQAMSLRERQAVHAALATALDGDPDRRAWHRAAASVGKSEPIATELEQAASRAEQRGASVAALEAVERAAQLSEDPVRRGNRLLRAVRLALQLGRQGEALRLLGEINDTELQPLDRAEAAWTREIFAHGSWSGASRVASFVDVAEQMRIEGHVDRAFEALSHIALRCWWSNPDRDSRASLVAAAERLRVSETDPRLINVLALAAPEERGAVVLERLSRRRTERHDDSTMELWLLGLAAMAVGDFIRSEQAMEAHIHSCRTQGLVGALAAGLTTQAWTKIYRGDWKQASSMASEGARWAEETGQGNFTIAANLAAATIAAYRGETQAAETLASAGEQALLPYGANPMLSLVQIARGAAALADGRYDEAYQHLRRILDPADNAYHPHVRGWAVVDLVEAAVHSGHVDDAAAVVAELERLGSRTRSPILLAGLEFARPLLTPGGTEEAFLGSGFASWPFARARLQLAHGLWLRRKRRTAGSRAPLRAARDAFDALGAAPWGERARQELRASGETSRRRSYALIDALSPQELQIAQLAAAGLSNKEIGRQLFVSHRTISTHLYRIFPKLGITARSHLRAALQAQTSQSPR